MNLSREEEMQTLNIVVPVYNEQECLIEMFNRLELLRKNFSALNISYIFINDGSSDGTYDILNSFCLDKNWVKVIHLSRNFGHQYALTAGLDHSHSDYVAIIDADLQDPPELIKSMYEKSLEGFDIVYGQRQVRKGEGFFKKTTAKFFYRVISFLCNIDIPVDTGDFRFINKRVLQALIDLRESHRFIRGMVPWVGFKATPLLYNRDERYAGKTKYPLRRMFRFALDAIFSFSNIPLKIASYMGGMIVALGLLGGGVITYLRLFTEYNVPGVATVILTILIMSGVQIVMLGIIGEYIGRIFEESKSRPLYVVAEKMNI